MITGNFLSLTTQPTRGEYAQFFQDQYFFEQS